MENIENREIDVVELVADLNGTAMTKNQVMEKYGMKDGKRKRFLKNNGYGYNQKNGKWEVMSTGNTTIDETKVTYRMPSELYKAVKMQAIFEGVNATDIVVKALEKYIPQTTKDIVEQNKK